MSAYLGSRVLQMIPTLLGISVLVFLLINMTPGCPAMLMLGEYASPSEVQRLRTIMGLDDPVGVRYFRWLADIITGDWGESYIDRRAVLPALLSRLPATAELVVASMVISAGIGIVVGVISAVHQDSWLDNVVRAVSFLGISMPNFWVGIMLILLLSLHLRLLPASGRYGLGNLVMPAIALGTSGMAVVARMTRSTMLEIVGLDYIRTARAKGISERRVLYKHALRPAMTSILTVMGMLMGFRLGGSVIIETVFAWPGIGRFAYLRMMERDYPMIMGNLLIFATFFCTINLLVDVLYAVVDPRVRYE